MEDKIAREVLRKLINILENGDSRTVTIGGWESVERRPNVLALNTRDLLLKELEKCDK